MTTSLNSIQEGPVNYSVRPLSQEEEELERQYQTHRTQFDEWKEKNKELAESATYKQYVTQFETWEEEVEKRRQLLRVAYSKKAIEINNTQSNSSSQGTPSQDSQRHSISPEESTQTITQGFQQNAQENNEEEFMSKMDPESFMMCMMGMMMFDPMSMMMMMSMNGEGEQMVIEESTPSQPQQPMEQQQQVLYSQTSDRILRNQQRTAEPVHGPEPQPQPMPQVGPEYGYGGPRGIWGGHAYSYDETDPMYRKWGQRAMPPGSQKGSFQRLPPGAPLPPGWVTGEPIRKQPKVAPPPKDYREPKLPFRDFSMR